MSDSDQTSNPTEDLSSSSNPNSLDELPDVSNLSLVQEFLLFIRQEKKWWLIPIMVVLGTLGLLAMLAQTGAAPFIYTLF